MQKSMLRKGLVVAVIVLFVIISINPITISRTNNYNTINEEQSFDILNPRNNPPIVNRTFPPDGAEDILVTGAPINAEIYDVDGDDLWVEVWSNFTGNWVGYAGWDVYLDWKNRTWSNESSLIVGDYNGDGNWTVVDLSWIHGKKGWGWNGNWGFFLNRSVTDNWGMTKCRTTYYWSVNITDNSTWTNETYHFTTERANIYVDDDAPPEWYDATHVKTIQEGVNNASTNDIIYVYNGTYYENVVVDKTITLIGEDKNTTNIDGGANGNVVDISADYVNVSKFTILNGSSNQVDAGIKIYSDYNCIRNNIIKSNNGEGVSLKYSNHNLIKNNIIDSNNDNGILIWDSNNNIVSNTTSSNNYVGIRFSDSSGNNILSNCNISYNDHGIVIESTITNNSVVNCTVYSNAYLGIGICHSGNHRIIKNTITNNYRGISIGHEFSSNDNIIYHNNLINNTINGYDENTNTWFNETLQEGNYWSDYTGNDTNGDCIGDTPYNISGGSNQDLYPFMYPNGWINNPPYPPSDPIPEDGEYDVPVTVILNWTGGDPDPCDTVTYDVYFGITNPPTKKVANQTYTSYEPLQLEICTKYYWQIITWDNHGVCTKGPIWSFTTFCVNFPPDMPVIDGPTSGIAGETYIYSFDADDLEGHDIYYFVDWGDETNTSWLGIYESGEKIYVNHTWSEKGTYEISARAKDVYDAIGDWGTLEVTMPKSKPFFYNSPILNWLFERFPNMFPILRHLLGL